ncbi:hypothetical protein PP178_04120 [Zeaxanthinibacter sp. PT1]|uniref:hypothetical protein n=1 Tax=Zeaxanthinibacter TaxID=561554 RepID=UPI00234A6A52|nr:hypothetical protein [Zeaxanthinibacter sp. PT1]MDC6350727.1 hypothetical protein [Zeaxanthinibacter sp. PT1]
MYNITQETGATEKYLNPGIHQNIKIVNIVKENSKKDNTGSTVLRFYFEAEDGATFNHTEFEIDPEKTIQAAKGWTDKPEEFLAQKFEELAARIKHILSAFMPEDQVILSANGWGEYCDKVVALAGNMYQDQKFRIKLVYNKKDYTTLPTKTFSPFIQNMEESDRLAITKYDRVVAAQPDTEAQYDADDNFAGDDDLDEEF